MMLRLNNITVHYGTAEAVKEVSISIKEGEVVSIIGANGAGKSTILKAISGLISLSSGEITFLDKKINGMAVNKIVGLGIAHVPEGRKLFPYMNVISNIKMGAYLRCDRAGISNDLEEVFVLFPRLKERRNQKAGSLSGGEQQMLAIARALMTRPRLLIMDEPSLGLAPIIIDQIGQLIKEINHKGITVLLVEQNSGLVTKVSKKCYVLEVGKVVLEGNIKKLLANDSVKRAFLG